VELFEDDVIYQLVEEYEQHVEETQRAQQETVLDKIVRPCRFRILEDHVFRQSNPAVVGVEVLSGTLKNNQRVVKFEDNEPSRVGELSGIQDQGEDVSEARAGKRVSVAIDGPTVGRQVDEGDELWIELPEKHAKILEQELTDEIPADELEALQGYLDKQRSRDPFWGK
jgi:translation initiation factor 5B